MSTWTGVWLTVALLLAPRLAGARGRASNEEVSGIRLVLWWINRLYALVWHRLRVEGEVALPTRGAAILIANHTSGADACLLQASVRRRLGFMINRDMYDYWLFHWMCVLTGCIPVDRGGRELSSTRAALEALRSGHILPIFPEGVIVPTSGREFGEVRPGVAFLALRSRVPVVPAYISGTPETTKIVPALLTPTRSRIVFGPPVDLSEFLDPHEGPPQRDAIDAAAVRLMEAIKNLRDERSGAESEPIRHQAG